MSLVGDILTAAVQKGVGILLNTSPAEQTVPAVPLPVVATGQSQTAANTSDNNLITIIGIGIGLLAILLTVFRSPKRRKR